MSFKPGDIILRGDASYPSGALVVSGFGENGELLAYPKGGGREYRIPASDIARFSLVTEVERTPIYRRGIFAIEGVEEKFAGWWDGECWNGWAEPKFELAEAGAVVAAVCPGSGRHDADTDTFITAKSEGEEELWPADTIALPDGGALKVYPVGAGSWIWENVEDEGRAP